MSEAGTSSPSIGEAPDEKQATLTVDDIYSKLRAEILHGALPAGEILSQVQLAKRLEVNRTPLREALRMLQRDRLIESEYNRRVRIAPLSGDDLEQIYAVRLVQEAVAVRLSVDRYTEDDLTAMRTLLDRMAGHTAPGDFPLWEHDHREFHRLLVCHAGARIEDAVADLSDYAERYRRKLVQQHPVSTHTIGAKEHRGILDACVRRDMDEASSLVARHLSRTALTLLSIIDPAHDPRAVREALRAVIGDAPQPAPFEA